MMTRLDYLVPPILGLSTASSVANGLRRRVFAFRSVFAGPTIWSLADCEPVTNTYIKLEPDGTRMKGAADCENGA
jgi:hypothetical protein